MLIPTYQRPDALQACLLGISQQTLPASEVVVVRRIDDYATADLLAKPNGNLPLHVVVVSEAGVVAALNGGLVRITSHLVAITDDDAVPHADWLERMAEHFNRDSRIGGVGGRDWIHHGKQVETSSSNQVGRVSWWGRVVGNHHLGVGDAREVDVLKGVNCAYRTASIIAYGFDRRLRGSGAQVHWELSLGLSMRSDGWKLIYDPQIQVDHYEQPRHIDERTGYNWAPPQAVADAAYNEAIVLLDHLSAARRMVYIVWSIVIGTRLAPGMIQAIRLTGAQGSAAWRKFLAVLAARCDAIQAFRRGNRGERGAIP